MATETPIWILLSTAFGGATIALLGTFFSDFRKEKNAKKERTRDKLEEVYLVLVKADIEYNQFIQNLIESLISGEKIEKNDQKDIPPLFHLEMLIHGYFKDLKKEYLDLQEFVDATTRKYWELGNTVINEEEANELRAEYIGFCHKLFLHVDPLKKKICEKMKL